MIKRWKIKRWKIYWLGGCGEGICWWSLDGSDNSLGEIKSLKSPRRAQTKPHEGLLIRKGTPLINTHS
jgi:hypothetical protein